MLQIVKEKGEEKEVEEETDVKQKSVGGVDVDDDNEDKSVLSDILSCEGDDV